MYCGCPGPSIVDHGRGQSYRHMKILIGHFFCTSKCQRCDDFKTHGNHRKHYKETGLLESTAWLGQVVEFNKATGIEPPPEVDIAMVSFQIYERGMYT